MATAAEAAEASAAKDAKLAARELEEELTRLRQEHDAVEAKASEACRPRFAQARASPMSICAKVRAECTASYRRMPLDGVEGTANSHRRCLA